MASTTFSEVVKERFDTFCSLCGLHGLSYLRSSNALPTTERKKLFFSSLVCKNKEFFKDKKLSVGQEEMETFYNFLAEASPTCGEMFSKCSWQGVEFPCCQEFFPVVTSIGRCYVFNTLPSNILYSEQTIKELMFNDSYPHGSRFWLPIVGYPKPDHRGDPGYHTFPRWSSLAGQDSGLSVELHGNMSEWQEQCTGEYQGFKVVVNSPAEASTRTFAALSVPMQRDFLVHINPLTFRTSVEFEVNDVRLRGCVFQSESMLNNFGTYTTDNCILQCILDLSLEMCDCVSFYLPRNSSIRVCSDDTDNKCLELVASTLIYNSIHNDDKDYTGDSKGCTCYPPCNEVTYNYETSRTHFFPETDTDNGSSEHKVFAKISVYFNSLKFLGVHRQAISTLYDFLATCGGLLGLLTGFSCISAVEIIYHLLIRPIGYLLLCNNKHQTIPPVTTRPPIRTNKNFLVDHYYYN